MCSSIPQSSSSIAQQEIYSSPKGKSKGFGFVIVAPPNGDAFLLDRMAQFDGSHKKRVRHILDERAVSSLPIRNPSPKRAVISGRSISGMIAAAILAKAGYEVDIYDIRNTYTRNIQWAVRESLVNELASIDRKLAVLFLQKVARPLHNGSIHIKNGNVRIKPHDKLSDVDPYELPDNGNEMISIPSVFSVECRVFERVLNKYLSQNFKEKVRFHTGKITVNRVGESFSIENLGITPDLVVIAEGANSETRNALGIQPKPVSEPRWQVVGALGIDSGGTMIKHWREAAGQCMLTGVIGHAGAKKTWLVADVDPSKCNDQNMIDAEFKRLGALALQKPIEEIEKLKIYGPADKMNVPLFCLQQTITDRAFLGDNLILMGDAVGSGHWSAGGGVQIAAVCHAQRLKTLILQLSGQRLKRRHFVNILKGCCRIPKLGWK